MGMSSPDSRMDARNGGKGISVCALGVAHLHSRRHPQRGFGHGHRFEMAFYKSQQNSALRGMAQPSPIIHSRASFVKLWVMLGVAYSGSTTS